MLASCRDAGYGVLLIFLWLPSPQAALARVARRVRRGGHGVPENVVLRRYWAGLRNLRHLYLPLSDGALIYDNSSRRRILIAELLDGRITVHDQTRWRLIEGAAG